MLLSYPFSLNCIQTQVGLNLKLTSLSLATSSFLLGCYRRNQIVDEGTVLAIIQNMHVDNGLFGIAQGEDQSRHSADVFETELSRSLSHADMHAAAADHEFQRLLALSNRIHRPKRTRSLSLGSRNNRAPRRARKPRFSQIQSTLQPSSRRQTVSSSIPAASCSTSISSSRADSSFGFHSSQEPDKLMDARENDSSTTNMVQASCNAGTINRKSIKPDCLKGHINNRNNDVTNLHSEFEKSEANNKSGDIDVHDSNKHQPLRKASVEKAPADTLPHRACKTAIVKNAGSNHSTYAPNQIANSCPYQERTRSRSNSFELPTESKSPPGEKVSTDEVHHITDTTNNDGTNRRSFGIRENSSIHLHTNQLKTNNSSCISTISYGNSDAVDDFGDGDDDVDDNDDDQDDDDDDDDDGEDDYIDEDDLDSFDRDTFQTILESDSEHNVGINESEKDRSQHEQPISTRTIGDVEDIIFELKSRFAEMESVLQQYFNQETGSVSDSNEHPSQGERSNIDLKSLTDKELEDLFIKVQNDIASNNSYISNGGNSRNH